MPLVAAESLDWAEFAQLILVAAVFGLLGIALLALGFKVFERITPKLDVEDQLRQGNLAVGITVGSLLIGISVIVAVVVG